MLTTESVTREFQTTLSYIKFAERLKAIHQTVEDLIDAYRKMTETVVPAEVPDIVRDKKDRIILAAAVGGRASHIVSGDKDLLILEQFETIPILAPTQFLAIF